MEASDRLTEGWEEEYYNIQENAVCDFLSEAGTRKVYDRVDKKYNEFYKTRNGTKSWYLYWDSSAWKNFTYLGKMCSVPIYKDSRKHLTKEQLKRVDMVAKNLTTKTLHRYLVNTYNDEGLKPSLSSLGITDFVSLMRAINMQNTIMRVYTNGNIIILGNLKDNEHSYMITFPKGVFKRKEPGQKDRWETKYNNDNPLYTWLEIYNEPIDLMKQEDMDEMEEDE